MRYQHKDVDLTTGIANEGLGIRTTIFDAMTIGSYSLTWTRAKYRAVEQVFGTSCRTLLCTKSQTAKRWSPSQAQP